MTGSSLAPVIIPIVVSIGLAVWLTMVYRAASHPRWKHQRGRHLAAVTPQQGPATVDARQAVKDGTAVNDGLAEVPHAA